MKRVLVLILFIISSSAVIAQEEASKSSVTIIGTIHNGNKQFGYKTLFRTLQRIKPDIILTEQNSPWKRVFGLQTASFLGIWHPGIEQRALQKYSRNYNNCIILPYDTTIAERKKYPTTLYQNTNTILELLEEKAKNSLMSKPDSIACVNYLDKRNKWLYFIVDTTLERINKPDIIELTKEVYLNNNEVLTQLINKYIADEALRTWHQKEESFWVPRNTYMGQQILAIAKKNPGKRIVVLTGLAHTYFLQDYLQLNGKHISLAPFSE